MDINKKDMKPFMIFILVSVFIIPYASGQVKKDTTFLLREFINGSIYHAVFKENGRNPSFYNHIRNYISIDSNVYNQAIKDLKDSLKGPVKKIILKNLDHNWYSLHQYKDKYYVYAASEPYVNLWVGISDTTITMNYFSDGVIPAFIKTAKWINNATVDFQLISKYETDRNI